MMSLRSKMITGGIAAVIIPLLIVGLATFTLISRSLEDLFRENTSHIAIDIATRVQTYLVAERNLVIAMAQDPQIVSAVLSQDYQQATEKFQKLFRVLNRGYESLFFADSDGVVRADAHIAHIGVRITGRDYFNNARTGKPIVAEPMISRATGEMIVVICAPVYEEDGSFAGVVASAVNIANLLETIASLRIGSSGYAVLVNSQGEILLHPAKEIMRHTNLLREPELNGLFTKILSDGQGTMDYKWQGVRRVASFASIELIDWTVIVAQDRKEIMAPARAILVVFFIGGVVFLLIAIVVITLNSRKISTPVQKTLDILQQVKAHTAEMIMHIGPDRKIESVNPATEKLLNKPASEIVGTAPKLRNTADMPDDQIWELLDQGGIWTGRVVMDSLPEKPVTLDLMLIPLNDQRGLIGGYLGIARDVSHELVIEGRLRQAEKMQSIGTLAGGIAHDFNNILSSILGFTELAMHQLDNREKTKHYLEEVLKAGRRAGDLVNRILTFSRQSPNDVQTINPKAVVAEALKFLYASIPSTIQWKVELKNSASILADPTQLHQVVFNLCTNAAHAMNDGKGKIEVTLEDFDVDATYSRMHPGISPGRHVRLRVSDNGCGIAPANLQHIFDPFFTTKPVGQGTGLGLSVVHGTIQKINGIISVYSEVDKGTTFDIVIPAAYTAENENSLEHRDEPPGGHERLLVVDDETPIVTVLETVLVALGYRVNTYSDSRGALDHLLKHPDDYDMLITDYTMPHVTGTEMARTLRDNGIFMPILLCSGHIHESMQEAAELAGICRLLTKPVTRHELALAIRQCFDGSAGT